jgi:uncharacterized protein with GYD domain
LEPYQYPIVEKPLRKRDFGSIFKESQTASRQHGLSTDEVSAKEKGKDMAYYMCQVSYTREAFKTLIKKPHDRSSVVRAAVEKLGGNLVGFWYAFGDYDAVLILEMPDNSSAAALPLAAVAGGAISASHTTVLMTPAEAIAALKKASKSGYRPPSK